MLTKTYVFSILNSINHKNQMEGLIKIMSNFTSDYGIKNLYIKEFQVWNYDDDTKIIDEIIINAINSSEGVYVYRKHAHLLEENSFIKWIKNEFSLLFYNQISLEFKENNKIENLVPQNNETVYFLEFNENDKANFLEHFKLSITAIKNRIGKEKTIKYLEKNFYVDNPLYDQYDFIFTVGDQAILFTDIHDFTFIKAEV